MIRRAWTMMACLLGITSLGCAMCQSPFDYVGPVGKGTTCPRCGFNTREGSILGSNGGASGGMEGGSVSEQAASYPTANSQSRSAGRTRID
jgi:hypothetical protein